MFIKKKKKTELKSIDLPLKWETCKKHKTYCLSINWILNIYCILKSLKVKIS